MASKKRITRIVILLLLLGAAGTIASLQFRTEQSNRRVISLDGENSLIITRLDSKAKGTRTFIARSHIDKGILWKRPFEEYESDYLYEPRYHRDVMLKDGVVTFYSEGEELLYQFDYENGTVLRTLELPRLADGSLYWTALQDKDSLYLLSGKNDGGTVLKALNFRDLSERWELDLSLSERIIEYPWGPLQNEKWIALHNDVDGGRTVTVISKENGENLNFQAGETGFLLDDFYYYLEPERKNFVRQNLQTGDQEVLFPWEDSFPSPQNYRYSSLWLYRNQLVHLSGDERNSSLKIRKTEDGSLIREIPLPEGYLNIVPALNQAGASAPEFTGNPNISTPFFPLIMGGTGPDSFSSDNIWLAIVLVDLEKGRVHWESRPVYVSTRFSLFNSNESNFYDDGMYGIFVSLPQRSDSIYESLILMDGNSGEITGCVRVTEGEDYLSGSRLTRLPRRADDGLLYALSDRAVLRKDLTIAGKDARKYGLEDMSDMMGVVYGF